MPKTIRFADADARFQVGSLLPAYSEEDVILLPPGSYDASALDLDENSYVVDGDLFLDGNVSSAEEGHFLFVQGNLRVDNLLLGGPIVYVAGSLSARHAIHTDYNHGWLKVCGDVHAQIIAAEHSFYVGGMLHCDTTIDFGGFEVSDPNFMATLSRQQAARESSEHFVAEVLNDQGYVNGSALAELLAGGKSPLLP